MSTKNMGLVKALFKKVTPPIRTDVLWYDTTNNVLNVYDLEALAWIPIFPAQLNGALTDSVPTGAEITSIVGKTAVVAGKGYKVTIKDTTGTGLLYKIESDGVYWFYTVMTKAL